MHELKNNSELRARFEEDLIATYANQPHPNLSKFGDHKEGNKGRYKDNKVDSMWKGYQLFARTSMRIISKKETDFPLGRYVIGKVIDDGKKVQFARIPFRHQTRKLATEEMNRLVEIYNEPFALFRCVEINSNTVSKEDFEKRIAKINLQKQIDQLQQELLNLN